MSISPTTHSTQIACSEKQTSYWQRNHQPLIYRRIDRTLSPHFASDHANSGKMKEKHSLNLIFEGGDGQFHALATLPQEKNPWYVRIGGSWRKISAPAEN
jgi:hypothetical protein